MATDVRKAAKSAGKGAAERLKAGCCLTSLSEVTRKVLGQRQAKRLPNVASCLTPLFLGRAPPADGWGRRIYIYICLYIYDIYIYIYDIYMLCIYDIYMLYICYIYIYQRYIYMQTHVDAALWSFNCNSWIAWV